MRFSPFFALPFLFAVSTAAAPTELNILWFQWAQCDALESLSAGFRPGEVAVKTTCVPISEWYRETFEELDGRKAEVEGLNTGAASSSSSSSASSASASSPAKNIGTKYDLLVLDSQWVGEAVTRGHVEELTDMVEGDAFQKQDFVPQALAAYGEYPPNSERYYGAPIMGDVQMLMYRKDIFRSLGRSEPQSLEEMAELAELLDTPASHAAHGISQGYSSFYSTGYDETSTIYNQLAWSHGGSLWDDKTYRVKGVLDSGRNAEALEFMKRLYATTSKRNEDGFDTVIEEMCQGRSPMATIWMGFAGLFADPSACAQAGNIGFAPIPELAKTRRTVLSLGGMGIHLSSYTAHKAVALEYLDWLMERKTQRDWASRGGFSARRSVISTNEFIRANDYNLVYFLSYPLTKDFWNLPEYAEMLTVHNKYLGQALVGNITSEAALAAMADEQQAIIDKSYPCGPVCVPEPPDTSGDTGSFPLLLVLLICGGVALLVITVAALLYLRQARRSRTIVTTYVKELEEGRSKLTVAEVRARDAEKRANAYVIPFSDLSFDTLLGEGAYGAVYSGLLRDTVPCAIKRLKAAKLDEKSLAAFRAEVMVLERLRHPNIVLLMGASVTPPDLAIVTELMSHSLSEMLRNDHLHLELATMLNFARDTASALAYLHSNDPPILHRDLKADNLLIDDKMRVKVADFGLSATREITAKNDDVMGGGDKDHVLEGSLYWLAPEVLNGGKFTVAADVYAFGVTMLEIFSRQDPWNGDISGVAAAANVRDKPDFRPPIPATVPTGVADVIRSCWSHNPEDRPSFKQVLSRLDKVGGSLGVSHHSGSGSMARAATNPAPTGPGTTIVFTDIQGSTELWEAAPSAMREAIDVHHGLLRQHLRACMGYEVKTEGDAFMIAFPSAAQAINFCAAAQRSLLRHDWEPELLAVEAAAPVLAAEGSGAFKPLVKKSSKKRKKTNNNNNNNNNKGDRNQSGARPTSKLRDGNVDNGDDDDSSDDDDQGGDSSDGVGSVTYALRGLRVRMGVHAGSPTTQMDMTTRRFDYYGPDVNLAARIEGATIGGQIMCSAATRKAAEAATSGLGTWFAEGSIKLRGIKAEQELHSFHPSAYPRRKFPPLHMRGTIGSTAGGTTNNTGGTTFNNTTASNTGSDKSRVEAGHAVALLGQEAVGGAAWVIQSSELVIGELLGRGSFGEVHRGTWRGTTVAVKRLLQQRYSERAVLDFFCEMTVLANLRHPHTVLFMGACTEPSKLAIVTEYVTRGSLHAFLSGGDPRASDPRTLVNLAHGASKGLTFLHASGVLHRDVKSHNILITSDYSAKLTDFGLSTAKKGGQTQTMVGSACWMSPELLGGSSYGEPSDVFSFGVTLWEIGSGSDPAEGMSSMAVARRTLQDGRPSLESLSPWARGNAFQELIEQCWNPHAKKRPTMAEVEVRLARIAAAM